MFLAKLIVNKKIKCTKKKFKQKYKKIVILFRKSFVLGILGIKALSWGLLTNKQLESTRRTIIKKTQSKNKKKLKFFVRKNINFIKTSKPENSRMGKGIGKKIKKHVGVVNKGDIIFEISYFIFKKSLKFLFLVKNKFSFKSKIIFRLFFK